MNTEETHATSRRSFLAGAGASALGAGLVLDVPSAIASRHGRNHRRRHRLPDGDVAILRFLAAAEIIETDVWQQYNELAGVQDSGVPAAAATLRTPPPWRASTTTCRNTSMTTPTMRSAISHSSTPT